ncbi:MAG: SUMF1/EgtB/PvdO family nonheme iron enzyme, partial [Anaerolineae bacterium]|nr:SUMF1/EgtB/PvdO family nonheme iron enzyme [Anaerolineae bacterium]
PFGVMDMNGNVYEWCLTDPKFGTNMFNDINERVLRGGAWDDGIQAVHNAARASFYSLIRDKIIGFRVVCIPLSS